MVSVTFVWSYCKWSLDQEFVIYALHYLLRYVGYSFMFRFDLREEVQRDVCVKT
jgi:hypothetical protein